MLAGSVPREKQSSIFDEQMSFLVATNVVQKPFNNELHFEVDQFKIKFLESDTQTSTHEKLRVYDVNKSVSFARINSEHKKKDLET